MKIEDIKAETLKSVDDNELYVLRLRAINLYERHFYNSRCIRIGKLERSELLDNYQLLVSEMKERGLRYNDKAIDRAVFRKAMFGIDVRDLGDLVIVPDYMSIAGSFVKDPAGAEDVDIVIRDSADNRDQGVELKVGRTVKMRTGKEAHFVYAPRGPHSTFVPMFDLVLRGKHKMERVPVEEKRSWGKAASKPPEYYEGLDSWDMQLLEDNWNVVSNLADGSVLDLGCGTGRLLKLLEQSGRKVAGIDNDRTALRYCRKRGLDVVDVDLEEDPLPYDSNSWDNVVMVHSLEHVKNTEHLLREAERVAAERIVALVPLGKRYDPTHAHEFKTAAALQERLADDSRYAIHEIKRSNAALVRWDKKAVAKARELTPFGRYDPPKPTMAGLTEAYSVKEIASWAKDRTLVAEPKLNGFRMVLAKQGDTVKIMSENRENHAAKYPTLTQELARIPGAFILDSSVGIERDGKPLPRIELMTLMAAKPQLGEKDRIVATVFDMPYRDKDLHDQPFSERRKALEEFYGEHLKASPHFDMTRSVQIKSLEELEDRFKEFARLPQSEGVVIKDVKSTWSLDGSEPGWAKLKVEAEIKAQVLDRHTAKGGRYVYSCGVLKADSDYANTTDVDSKKLVVLGKTYTTEIKADIGDILTVGIEELIPQDGKLVWLGPRVIDKDSGRKEPYTAAQAADVARRANVLQVTKAKTLRGIYVQKPQGAEAMKSGTLLLGQKLSSGYVGKRIYLVENKHILGVVQLRYTGRDGFKAAYELDVIEEFEPPVGYDPPPGIKNTIRDVTIDKTRYDCECIDCGHRLTTTEHCVELKCPKCGGTMRRADRPGVGQVAKDEGTTGAEGNIDFEPGTKGTGVLQAHIMGIEEDQTKALKEAQSRILVARFTPAKLERALKDVLGEKGVHCDIRLRPAGKDYWEGGEILVGNLTGLSKLDKLDTENAKLRFSWKVSHKGERQQNIVRGPLSWMTAGKQKIEIFEPGTVGASAHKYAALVNLDSFDWEIYKADEHAKKIRFTGGRILDGNYLFSYVPTGEGERVWMMSRLKDSDHQAVTKEAATKSHKCKYCDKPAVKSHIWADGRAYVPVCAEHSMKGMADIKAQGGRVLRTVAIEEPVAKALNLEFRILKQLKTKQIVGGVVYEPDVVDTQGDYTSAQDIQDAMYRFMEKYAKDSQRIKVQHRGKSYTFPILECFQPEHDITRGGQTVKKGSWWLMLKITEPGVWNLIQEGHITAFSMGGTASSG